ARVGGRGAGDLRRRRGRTAPRWARRHQRRPRAAGERLTIEATTGARAERMIVGGAEVEAASGATFTTHNPATGGVLAQVPSAAPEDVDRAVRAATGSFEQGPWASMFARERGRLLLRLADAIRERAEDLARLETSDTGKPISDTRQEILYSADVFEYYGGAANKLFGTTVPVAADGLDYTL